MSSKLNLPIESKIIELEKVVSSLRGYGKKQVLDFLSDIRKPLLELQNFREELYQKARDEEILTGRYF